jgi:hypothetical protein
MFLQHEAYEWMKTNGFAKFLNKMGHTRPKYGGVLVKKVEDSKNLDIQVVEWKNVVTDQVDILGGTIIEKHWMTPVELSKKKGSWNNVNEAIENHIKMQSTANDWDDEAYNSERICVYEVHGEFPKGFVEDANDLDENFTSDKYEFSRQRYFYAKFGEEKKTVFLAEEFDELIYDYIPWEEIPGRGLGRGVIEDSEEAQVWSNDTVINEKNAMDLAGKVVMKTNSSKLGNNILEVDNGKIFDLEDGKDLVPINLAPTALGQFQAQINRWELQADKATSTFDANIGEAPPSGTPYSPTARLNPVASPPFDYRREENGILVSRIIEKWVIPFLVKKLYKKHILVSDFSEEELAVIDHSFAVFKANEKVIKGGLKGKLLSKEEYDELVEKTKSSFRGTKRYLEIPDGYFKGIESKVTVNTTNEQKDKAAILQSLSTILQTVSGSFNPQTGQFTILENPILAKIFGTILEISGSGISPVSIGVGKPSKPAQAATPTPPPVPPLTPSMQTPQAVV